jgi:hypothetical protein
MLGQKEVGVLRESDGAKKRQHSKEWVKLLPS